MFNRAFSRLLVGGAEVPYKNSGKNILFILFMQKNAIPLIDKSLAG